MTANGARPSADDRARFLRSPFEGRSIALGVTGSIAAYKALSLASRLVQGGAALDVILTRAASELVRPLAFEALTHRPASLDLWDPAGPMAMDHIAIAHRAELLVVAPTTADALARLALGLAGDALGTTALAVRCPIVLAPAMEPRMWSHPATMAHAATLMARGVAIVGPTAGRMASGEHGIGRMAEPDVIVEHLAAALGRTGPLAGRRIVVSAGPTRELIDPVRFLSNGSTGRMGYAIARRARDLGADVVLVSGPVDLAPPPALTLHAVESADEMCAAVLNAAVGADVVVMTAAVADYKPTRYHAEKVKKGAGDLTVHLDRTADILVELAAAVDGRADAPVRVGFAAETSDLVANARDKLVRKHLDLIVANPVPASFGGASSEAILVDRDHAESRPPGLKADLAGEILWRIHGLLAARDTRIERAQA
ncbi:MAG: bifunctional phosphopantothenoylcysteine decarboxylase/phosphopantothenate--cysteine ligase CoaBC [Ardenticatenales bacterium]